MTHEVLLALVAKRALELNSAISVDRVIEYYKDWKLTPFYRGGSVEAIGISSGPLIHWVSLVDRPVSYRVMSESIKTLVSGSYAKYGFAMTTSQLEGDEFNQRCERFVERLGFKAIDTGGPYRIWIYKE